jgi:glycosyltransferase involved in cell wall biosynthesis
MTTYNGASFLSEQLDSILAQTRLPDELIVCDDRSDDDTPSILKDYATISPFPMKVVINRRRLGSTKNFEKAIGLCSGDIIALSDQDDVWRPHKLATIEQRFKEDPDLGLVFTNGVLIDERSEWLRGDMWTRFKFNRRRQRMLCGPRAYDLLLSLPFITGATMAFRSKFKNLILPIPDGIPTFVHDRWIGVLIAAVGRIGLIKDCLIAYRLHPRQQIGIGKLPLLLRYTLAFRSSSDRAALTAMQQRLADRPSWRTKPDFDSAMQVRQRHLAARLALHRNPVVRLRDVAMEYSSGRYNRYPMGLRHALKDFLRGTQ